jgi:hypothetical protein
MAMRLLQFFLLVTLVMMHSQAEARPFAGFHQGPYLQLVTGVRDASFDTNVADHTKSARDIEPVFGFNFGWNITDPWAVELRALYSSAGVTSIQQHLINAHVNARWSLITDALTDFVSLRILPFLSAGGVIQANILPGATGATDTRVLQWGGGISGGGGISFLFFHDQVYLNMRGSADLINRGVVEQSVGGTSTRVYDGGWGVDWAATAGLGVHF